MPRLLISSALLISLQCGCGGAPPAERPSAATPSSSTPQPAATRPISRTLSVVALIDSRQQRVPDHEAIIQGRIAALSAGLTEAVGMAARLDGVEPLPDAPLVSLERRLGELEQRLTDGPALPPADLYVAIVADPLPDQPVMTDVVVSRYGGRIVVMRALAAAFDAADDAARLAAEQALLLHGIGRIFGAVDACGPFIMGRQPPVAWASPALRPLRWHPLNLALIQLHESMPLPEGAAQAEISPALAADAAARLKAPLPSEIQRCSYGSLERRRRLLQAIAEATPPAAKDSAPKDSAPKASPPKTPAAKSPAPAGLDEGLAALESERWQAAYDLCRPLADAFPQSEAPRCAGLAAEQLDQPQIAIPLLRAHLAHHTADDTIMLRLARLIGRTGDDGAARALLEGFVARNPNAIKARLNLGVAYARLGKYDEARAQWEAALRIDPESETARKLLDQLP